MPVRSRAALASLLQRFGLRAQQEGPPDLDELWRDFKRKLGGLMPGFRPLRAALEVANAAFTPRCSAAHQSRLSCCVR